MMGVGMGARSELDILLLGGEGWSIYLAGAGKSGRPLGSSWGRGKLGMRIYDLRLCVWGLLSVCSATSFVSDLRMAFLGHDERECVYDYDGRFGCR